MESIHAMLQTLRRQRREFGAMVGNQPICAAACDVLDWLIVRTQAAADRRPRGAKFTLGYLRDEMDDDLALLQLIATTFRKVADLLNEGVETVGLQHHPMMDFVKRIESEGYWAGLEPGVRVIDALELPEPDDIADPAVNVQLAAEKIARAEQAVVYQQRLERMDAAAKAIQDEFARRIRGLIGDGG